MRKTGGAEDLFPRIQIFQGAIFNASRTKRSPNLCFALGAEIVGKPLLIAFFQKQPGLEKDLLYP
jgi:hypothetical protein